MLDDHDAANAALIAQLMEEDESAIMAEQLQNEVYSGGQSQN